MERTLVLLKPDAVQRGLLGEIISRFENKGLKVAGMKMMQLTNSLLDEHYSHLNHLPFFGEIKAFMMLAPVVAVCLEGVNSVETVRRLCGVTKSWEADPGNDSRRPGHEHPGQPGPCLRLAGDCRKGGAALL